MAPSTLYIGQTAVSDAALQRSADTRRTDWRAKEAGGRRKIENDAEAEPARRRERQAGDGRSSPVIYVLFIAADPIGVVDDEEREENRPAARHQSPSDVAHGAAAEPCRDGDDDRRDDQPPDPHPEEAPICF